MKYLVDSGAGSGDLNMAESVKRNGQICVLPDSDLAEFDDKEFDIPPVKEEQTLEEILSTPDDDLPLLDYSIPDSAAVRAVVMSVILTRPTPIAGQIWSEPI